MACVQLPIKKPNIYYDNCVASTEIICSSHPTMDNWYLNNIIQMQCVIKNNFCLSINNVVPWVNPCIKEISVYDFCDIINCSNKVIKNLINYNCYVYFFGIDDYYIKGKEHYKNKHIYGNGLITGYDECEGTYTITAIDNKHKFSCFKVSQSDINRSIKKYSDHNFGKIHGFELIDKSAISINMKTIVYNLEEYLNPISIECSEERMNYGINVINKLICFIQNYGLNKNIINSIMILKQHKELMYRRIKYIEDYCIELKSLSNEYYVVVKIINTVLKLAISYEKTDCDLYEITKLLSKIFIIEKAVLKRIIMYFKGNLEK